MTWSFWVKLRDTGNYNRGILNKYIASAGGRSYDILISSSESLYLRISSDGSNNEVQIAQTDLDANWNHIIIVFDNGTFDVYKNGQVVSDDGDFTSQTSIYGGSGDLLLGVRDSDYMRGLLDEIRIYNRALSAAEIGDLYNLGKVKIIN
jgi:hypothetical protein